MSKSSRLCYSFFFALCCTLGAWGQTYAMQQACDTPYTNHTEDAVSPALHSNQPLTISFFSSFENVLGEQANHLHKHHPQTGGLSYAPGAFMTTLIAQKLYTSAAFLPGKPRYLLNCALLI